MALEGVDEGNFRLGAWGIDEIRPFMAWRLDSVLRDPQIDHPDMKAAALPKSRKVSAVLLPSSFPILPRASGKPGYASVPSVDQVMAEERAASFSKRSIKTGAKLAGLKIVCSMMDLTTLEGKDTPGKVAYLCRKALHPAESKYEVPSCAAVCVYPNMVRYARRFLGNDSPVRVASVATGFPSGQYPLRTRLEETRRAVADGADEIDMVIDRNAFLVGEHAKVFDEIAAVKNACGPAHLKVILETGELVTYDNVRLASRIAMEAGADFIKTSTGKVQPAATMPVTLVMLEAIRDYFLETGVRIGMKPAGGIRTSKQALAYLVMVKETLGDDWLSAELFRFGASTLLNDVLMQIAKTNDGNYQGADYFSLS